MTLQEIKTTARELFDQEFQAIKSRHPMLAMHLYGYIRLAAVDGGGFTIVGVRKAEIYATAEEAQDARDAAIMRVLREVEHAYH